MKQGDETKVVYPDALDDVVVGDGRWIDYPALQTSTQPVPVPDPAILGSFRRQRRLSSSGPGLLKRCHSMSRPQQRISISQLHR